MWWWVGCGVGGEWAIQLDGASYPVNPCPESDWGTEGDREDPDPAIRIERSDGARWVSAGLVDIYEPEWGTLVFDGVTVTADELMSTGLIVTPLENDTQNFGTFGNALAAETYLLETYEIRDKAFDVVAGCIEVRFSLVR